MLKGRLVFTFTVLMILFGLTRLSAADFKKGEMYHGFKLMDRHFVKEVNAECYYFIHEKSGARLLKIAADDPNKTFSIGFRTIPYNDCGIPHIIEHSVLNGSKNYPVKSPIDMLSKGSLQTYLNALTWNDKTVYPIASMNDKDYFNLMHVYLDAVLNPRIGEEPFIFMQEGWHYEMDSVSGPLKYKGVVYNEMKGAFSNPSRELNQQISRNLYPESSVRFSAGGYPTAIPALTYEKFLDYYKKYYHPSNSYIYLYGNADLEKELKFIDGEYLKNYSRLGMKIEDPLQKPFTDMKKVEAYYPVNEGEPTQDKTYLTLSFVAGLATDQELSFALNILSQALVNQEAAPVRLALQKAGIGQDVDASIVSYQQNEFRITVYNANPGDADKFKEVVFNTLRDEMNRGLDKKVVAGILNRTEFQLREGNDAQKGISYDFQVMDGWFYADDPYLSLEYEKPLADLKAHLNERFLESAIEKYFLKNPHCLLMTMMPKPGLEKENTQTVTKELEAKKNSLSESEKDKIVKLTADLKEYQKREDTPEAVATIPMLSKSDIGKETAWYDIKKEEINKTPVFFHEEFTNGVTYFRLLFNLQSLPETMIPYAAFMTEVLSFQNTDNYSYGDLATELNINTGGFETGVRSYLEKRSDDNLLPELAVNCKVMKDKTGKMFELIQEVLLRTKYLDAERLKTIVTKHLSRLTDQIKQDGYSIATSRAASYFSRQGKFNELTGGLDYYWFVNDMAAHFDADSRDICEKLQKAANLIFNRNNMIISVTSDKAGYDMAKADIAKFISIMPDKKNEYQTWKLAFENKKEGILAASKIQYVVKGFDFAQLGYKWSGKMYVLQKILSSDYLQNTIRVIGGAYGGFSAISEAGPVVFSSYRDPNLKETLENYDKASEYLKSFKADETEMTRYIIGTISDMDAPLAPSSRGNTALKYYLEKVTKEDLQKERNEVLNTSQENIRDMAKMIKEIMSKDVYCVYGNQAKIQAEKTLFNDLIDLGK